MLTTFEDFAGTENGVLLIILPNDLVPTLAFKFICLILTDTDSSLINLNFVLK